MKTATRPCMIQCRIQYICPLSYMHAICHKACGKTFFKILLNQHGKAASNVVKRLKQFYSPLVMVSN